MQTIEEKIQMIIRQTNYTEDESLQKLNENDYDHIKVIKKYLGVTEKKALISKTKNQEIYRQIRNFIYVPPKN